MSSDVLGARLDELAHAPVLLVASDFDGTIAPIVSNPEQAEADRESLVALKLLAGMPQTHVAIISGRALADLAARTADADELHLVGSHGSEFEAGFTTPLPAPANDLLERLLLDVAKIAESAPGSTVEVKPAALAFHYRNADERDALRALEAILSGPARRPGVHIRHGKKVIELSVVDTNKGLALRRIRQRLGASAVLFLGDDLTDEDAFATLAGPDVGVKVGTGESGAGFRIADTLAVAQVLARVAERRADWLAGSHAIPIEQHALLSDQRTLALVAPNGRVVWLCLPRLDSSAVFAELLGGPTAGFFEVRSVESTAPGRQTYIGDTFVLQTRWPGLTVTDYLDCGGGRAFQRAGRTDLIRVVEGRGRVRVTFAPRLDFGRMQTRLRVVDVGLQIEGALDPLVLRAPGLDWELVEEGRHQSAVATVEMTDEPLVLELRYGTASLAEDPLPEPARRRRTEQFWGGWASSLTLPGVEPDLVRRSALVLKALCYGPTGAIAAAGTTSLPESAGGVRNWDYRFCWPRDAAMAAGVLVQLGATGPAMKLLDWLLGILDQQETPTLLSPVYTVTGQHLGSEAEIAELAGYRGSRPVRVGNAAAQQVQLDVFGPIADLVALLAEHGAPLSSEHWRMLEAMVAAIIHRWQEPDHGIWEIRHPRRHHVHSKVMCWQTVDRALRVARYLGKDRSDWMALRRVIADDVLARGWQPEANAFCATYDDHEADAAALSVGLSGLLPPDDPRVLGTINRVERLLRDGPAVFRYRYDDGLPGLEGGFHLCTGWLIEAYALAGRLDDAALLFERLAALAGPCGLLSEQYDPGNAEALGNFPQAYSHLALASAALRLTR
ncbi:MAG TPA: trehalose-phosphatase [Phycisphaerae bacterium]|nr:trehalose-phosphatase [Phycisphaerae bacterium]HNU45101.1 trehalose-phosphatase [Phycisphaerae bacterium]